MKKKVAVKSQKSENEMFVLPLIKPEPSARMAFTGTFDTLIFMGEKRIAPSPINLHLNLAKSFGCKVITGKKYSCYPLQKLPTIISK